MSMGSGFGSRSSARLPGRYSSPDRYRADVTTLLGRDEEQERLAEARRRRSPRAQPRARRRRRGGDREDDVARRCRAEASDCTVLRVSGCESEQELTYAALHQLLRPLLPRYVELPDPQRRALGAAFGLLDALPVDRFLLGLAVLSLLGAAAQERPVLVIVDDAHLVDDGSLAVLSFVARRLEADRIAIFYGLRRDRPARRARWVPGAVAVGAARSRRRGAAPRANRCAGRRFGRVSAPGRDRRLAARDRRDRRAPVRGPARRSRRAARPACRSAAGSTLTSMTS